MPDWFRNPAKSSGGALSLAYPGRRKTGQTNRLAVSKLMVKETFPTGGKSPNRLSKSIRFPKASVFQKHPWHD
jgi:hypothetical protein